MRKDTNADARRTFYITIPQKVLGVVKFIVEDYHFTPLVALKAFYQSSTYRKLEVESTKYWHLGPVALYEDWLYDQQKSG